MRLRQNACFKVLSAIVVILFLTVIIATNKVISASKNASFKVKIVLDAGHGGIDVGCTGSTAESIESTLNLLIVNELKNVLTAKGFSVFLTRENEDGLYGSTEPGFKLRDLNKRVEITNEISPDLFVSVHLNKYVSASRRGAQVFFKIDDKNSKNLATKIQNSLNLLPESKRMYDPLKGDYYLLNVLSCPSVIVECGFLSNPEEEQLLLTKSYRQKLANSIADGIIRYLI